jgi:hypothetical protein
MAYKIRTHGQDHPHASIRIGTRAEKHPDEASPIVSRGDFIASSVGLAEGEEFLELIYDQDDSVCWSKRKFSQRVKKSPVRLPESFEN